MSQVTDASHSARRIPGAAGSLLTDVCVVVLFWGLDSLGLEVEVGEGKGGCWGCLAGWGEGRPCAKVFSHFLSFYPSSHPRKHAHYYPTLQMESIRLRRISHLPRSRSWLRLSQD